MNEKSEVILIFAAFLLGVGLLLRELTIPFLFAKGIAGINLLGLISLFKGRSFRVEKLVTHS